jgi:hypothetical protein
MGHRRPVTGPAKAGTAGGSERPAVDLPDHLLFAGVVLHDMLRACVGLGRGPAFGGGVPVALARIAP